MGVAIPVTHFVMHHFLLLNRAKGEGPVGVAIATTHFVMHRFLLLNLGDKREGPVGVAIRYYSLCDAAPVPFLILNGDIGDGRACLRVALAPSSLCDAPVPAP